MEKSICSLVTKHFGESAASYDILSKDFQTYQGQDLHLALRDIESGDPKGQCVGIVFDDYCHDFGLSKLVVEGVKSQFHVGPVSFENVATGEGETVSCVKQGLFLFQWNQKPVAILVYKDKYDHRSGIKIDVMAAEKDISEVVLAKVNRLVSFGQALRGKVISLEYDSMRMMQVNYHQLPQVDRESIILQEELLIRIDRQTLEFTRHAEKLKKAGRHLKRGILLHGPPGTGKTYTAMYLASAMEGRTTFVVTGCGAGMIEKACQMARVLEPATVILEDVDLIGTQRNRQDVGANAILFELLNQMDGLSADVDILFILTTNKPETLEAALSARPGRIDQAYEIPVPDAHCRDRLIDLYGEGLNLDLKDRAGVVKRCEGASAAFIKELLRKSALIAAIENEDLEEIIVRDEHVREALQELLVTGGALTKSLLAVND